MNQRPISVTIVGWVYIVTGLGSAAAHMRGADFLFPELAALLAFVSGLFLLRGRDWARRLALLWMAGHVVLSVFHSLSQVAAHAVFLAVLSYVLTRPPVVAYFTARASD